MRKRSLVAALSLLIGLASPAAFAGAVIGSTEPTQLLNNLQLAASYTEQAQQTATQINQYRAMLQNLQQIVSSGSLDQAAQKLWNDQNMTAAFMNLQKVVIGGQQTAYTMQTVDSKFRQAYPGYSGTANGTNFSQAIQNWSTNTLGAVQNSTSLLTAHSENFASEQGMMAELQRRSRSAQGQLEATQAGSDIGVAMVGQMQQLRQLQMAQMASQNAYIAGVQSKRDMGDKAVESVYGPLINSRLRP